MSSRRSRHAKEGRHDSTGNSRREHGRNKGSKKPSLEKKFERLTINDGQSTPRTSGRARVVDVSKQPQFQKVTVYASFVFNTSRTRMHASYMASGSRHGKNKAPIEDNDKVEEQPASTNKLEKMDVHSTGWTIRATAVFGDITLDGLVDTGSAYLLVSRDAVHRESLEKIPDEKDKQIALRFPFSPVKDVRGHLYKSTVSVGSQKKVQVEDQAFYVVDKLFDSCILGIGPPTGIALINHTIEQAPSLLQNAVAQLGLRGTIYGFNFSSWAKPGGTDEIDFGGIDKSSYAGNMHYVERSRSYELDTWYSFKVGKITCGSSSIANPSIGIIDSGAPAIIISDDMFQNMYLQNIVDRKIEYTFGDKGYKFPWTITISVESVEKLGTMIFEFNDMQNGKPFSVKIPPWGQVYPLSVGTDMGVPPDRRALAVGVCNAFQPYNVNVILGFPFFQEYYVAADLAHEPHRIGFANKTKTTESNAPTKPRYRAVQPNPTEEGGGLRDKRRHHWVAALNSWRFSNH